jgi:hypothetical protein
MTGKVLELQNVIKPDMMATQITEYWTQWDLLRNPWKVEKEEIRRYVYATDTTKTTNAQLPWKNKTTVPKLCHISDNLYSNYTATLFPQRKWLVWEANERDANSREKRDAIANYMQWVISQPSFKHEMDKVILDYIHFGNCFATVEWKDQRVELDNKVQAGYIGPAIRRISPLDMVMNPTAENFQESPKIVRSLVSMGELKALLSRMSQDENTDEYLKLYDYLKDIRYTARSWQGDWIQRDRLYAMEGFTSFRNYLMSNWVEFFTYYGDWHDIHTDEFQKNRVITVVDRHKLIGNKPNPSYFGTPPIYHVPWRKKTDNLWGMGPLDNLVGMQYRMDHIENMGADVWDLVTYPVQKIKGFVEEYTWEPGAKIFMGDEGDVDLVVPQTNVLQADMKIERIEALMEEMAGAPKEAMGFRTPGEKTKYEVQRLENAAARVFQNKIKQFEEQMVEPLLNAMLELARRNMEGITTIKVFDNTYNDVSFQDLTVEDITGVGRIKPVGARHFSEQADLIQNMTQLTSSGLWPTVQPHFSGIKLASILSQFFNIDDYDVVRPYVALSEQADAQKKQNALQEQVHMAAGTATGLGEDYHLSGVPRQQATQMPQIAQGR